MSNFDWIADEDSHWEPEPPKEPEKNKRPGRWLLLFFAAAALTVTGIVLFYRQADERLSAVEASVKADVLAAHQLILEAGMAGDVDLFRVGLSGRQQEWTAAQLDLLEDGVLWDRTPFGLTLQDEATAMLQDVEIASDLRQAVVTYLLPYQTSQGVMNLQHTAVYRRGENRWLFAPPEADFWGSWVTNRGSRVTLIYPQRDAALGERLAFDLDRMIRRLCVASFSAGCPADVQVTVRLSNQPDSLGVLFDAKSLLQNPQQLNFPAPTLLGIPPGEAGYEVLVNGYGAQIALAVTAEVIDYSCCQRGLYFRALSDWQLSELDLIEWPLTPDAFETLLRDSDSFQRSPSGWRSADISGQTDGEWIGAYALMQYLVEEREFEAESLQRSLTNSYDEWLVFTGIDSNEQVANWIRFLYDHSTSGQQVASPEPDPVSDLNLVCNLEYDLPTLYRYDFAAERWNNLAIISDDADYGLFLPVGVSGTIFVLEAMEVEHEGLFTITSKSYLWQNGRRFPIYDSAEDSLEGVISSVAYPVALDPQHQYLVLVVFTEGANESFDDSLVRLVDLKTCTEEGCATVDSNLSVEMILSSTVWSPTGEHMLLAEERSFFEGTVSQGPNYPLYLANGLGQELAPIGEGSGPFWLDAQTYGYLRVNDDGEVEAVTAVIGEAEPRVLLTMPDLQAALPEDIARYAPALRITGILPNTAVTGEFIVTAGSLRGQTNANYFFLLHQPGTPTQTIDYIEMLSTGGAAAFSPNGRYLQLVPHQYGNNFRRESVLMNLETGKKETAVLSNENFSGVFSWITDWSQDSKWLLQRFPNYLLIYAPDSGYQRLVPLGIPDCQYAFWSNR